MVACAIWTPVGLGSPASLAVQPATNIASLLASLRSMLSFYCFTCSMILVSETCCGCHGNLEFTFTTLYNSLWGPSFRESQSWQTFPGLHGFLESWYKLSCLHISAILASLHDCSITETVLPSFSSSLRYSIALAPTSIVASVCLDGWIWKKILL